MDLQNISLDDLFREARRAMHEQRAADAARAKIKRPAKTEVAPAPPPLTIYADPENWVRARGLALIDQATQRLLGNFWEWTHVSVISARRLVRATEPIPVDGVEEGDFSLLPVAQLPSAPRVETRRELVADIILDAPKVRAAHVAVCVWLWDGWTARVTLTHARTFAEGDELLLLPAGVDVLQVMSRESKRVLWALVTRGASC